jgi:RNA recognition motif-containing protein
MITTSPVRKLYVGNLPYSTKWEELKEDLTRDVGKVLRANIVIDRETGKSRGFAFIVVPEKEVTKFIDGEAIEYGGRVLKIKPAINKASEFTGNSDGSKYRQN